MGEVIHQAREDHCAEESCSTEAENIQYKSIKKCGSEEINGMEAQRGEPCDLIGAVMEGVI